jgi:hypothetical protein
MCVDQMVEKISGAPKQRVDIEWLIERRAGCVRNPKGKTAVQTRMDTFFPPVPRDATAAEAEAQLSRKTEFERDMSKPERLRLGRMAVTGTSRRGEEVPEARAERVFLVEMARKYAEVRPEDIAVQVHGRRLGAQFSIAGQEVFDLMWRTTSTCVTRELLSTQRRSYITGC